jgi:hypothetical protein
MHYLRATEGDGRPFVGQLHHLYINYSVWCRVRVGTAHNAADLVIPAAATAWRMQENLCSLRRNPFCWCLRQIQYCRESAMDLSTACSHCRPSTRTPAESAWVSADQHKMDREEEAVRDPTAALWCGQAGPSLAFGQRPSRGTYLYIGCRAIDEAAFVARCNPLVQGRAQRAAVALLKPEQTAGCC